MTLVSLAPRFMPKYHAVYLDLLERALQHRDTRSVALTGSFGSGKSSVLRAIPRWYWSWQIPWLHRRTVVELSLATLDPELAPVMQATNPAEKEMSNRIQKELVKQILYRLPPRKTSRSRFRRASKSSGRDWSLVAVAGVAAAGMVWIVVTLAGWQDALTQRLDVVGWPVIWFWGFVAGASVLLALASWRTFAGRYALQAGISAGALTLSLQPTSSSYFDQYLDEIMYFFQVSKASVVLIEDVDRFSDAIVFDTLRALNNLVNGSGQVGRRVVFVYAIRDSVLGEIGTKRDTPKGDVPGLPETEKAMQALDRSNRAKYFDVIIPIVPFVTTHNAQDLLMGVMDPHVAVEEGQAGVSPALIRLAARHVADMRTMWSIRNEFEVHLDRLITSADPLMPGINEDVVLSLVLLRATSPGAYESIRLGASPLDDLTSRWIELVDTNLKAQTDSVTKLRTEFESGTTREARARTAGESLDSLRKELLPLAALFTAQEVEYRGPVSDSDLANASGWQQIADGAPLTVRLISRPPGQRPSFTEVGIGAQMLERLIGMPIDPAAWQERDLDEVRKSIAEAEEEIAFLRHHTWEQLVARPDLTVALERDDSRSDRSQGLAAPVRPIADAGQMESTSEGKVSFKQLVGKHAPTPLAAELIEHGFLPRHFGPYSSSFYGRIVGVDAAEFLSRAVESGEPIIEYALDDESIAQILVEQGARNRDDMDLFDERSVYNLDIVTYLVKQRPHAAARVAGHLAERWNELEKRFIDRFFQRQDIEVSAKLAALMAPKWRQAIRYTSVDAQLPPTTRIPLVDAVLGNIGDDHQQDLPTEVGNFLSANYAALSVITDPPDRARADIVMKTILTAGGTLGDLRVLGALAMAAATRVSVYPVNEKNLMALGGAEVVALDVLRDPDADAPIYDHLLANLAQYLDALKRIVPEGAPVADPAEFTAVLNDVAAAHEDTLIDRFVGATSDKCRVADLLEAAHEAWPALMSRLRTDSTFDNVERYILQYGADEPLAQFFKNDRLIEPPQETVTGDRRQAIAVKILEARQAIPEPVDRVALAASVKPGVLAVQEIAGIDGGVVAPMLTAELFADDASAFDPAILVEWKDFEAAVAASKKFAEFADSTILPVKRLAPTIRSSLVPPGTKSALIANLPNLVQGADRAEASAIAEVAADRRAIVTRQIIDALREAGASQGSLVHLMAASSGLSNTDIVHVLLGMGGDYSRLAEGGSGVVHFEVDDDHRWLLDRLDGMTHTGAQEATAIGRGRHLRANLKRNSLDADE